MEAAKVELPAMSYSGRGSVETLLTQTVIFSTYPNDPHIHLTTRGGHFDTENGGMGLDKETLRKALKFIESLT